MSGTSISFQLCCDESSRGKALSRALSYRLSCAIADKFLFFRPTEMQRELGAVRQASPYDYPVAQAISSTCGADRTPTSAHSATITLEQYYEGRTIAQFGRRAAADAVAVWMTDQHSTILGMREVWNSTQTSANLSWSALTFSPDYMRAHILYSDCVEWMMPSTVPTWRGVVRTFVADMASYNRADMPVDVEAARESFIPSLAVDYPGKTLTFSAITISGSGPSASQGVVPFVYAESSVVGRRPETQILFLHSGGLGTAAAGGRVFQSPRLAFASDRTTRVRACAAVVHEIQCSEADLTARFVEEAEERYGVVVRGYWSATSPSSLAASVTPTTLRIRATCKRNGEASSHEASEREDAQGTGGALSAQSLENAAEPLSPLLYIRPVEGGANASVLAFNPLDLSISLQRVPAAVYAFVRCNETAPIERVSLDVASMVEKLGSRGGGSGWPSSGATNASLPLAAGDSNQVVAGGGTLPIETIILLVSVSSLFAVFAIFMAASHVSFARKLLRTWPPHARSRGAATEMQTAIPATSNAVLLVTVQPEAVAESSGENPGVPSTDGSAAHLHVDQEARSTA